MRRLRIRLCPLGELGAEAELDFEVLDERGAVLERGRAVPSALPRLARTALVVAAPDVLLVEAALPPLSGARLRAALPAIAEPHVLSDIEGAFVVGGFVKGLQDVRIIPTGAGLHGLEGLSAIVAMGFQGVAIESDFENACF